MAEKRIPKNNSDGKKSINSIFFILKNEIIAKICNGQISKRHASILYNISRSSIDYWMQKLTTFEQKQQFMSNKKEVKNLKDKIEELELKLELMKDIVIDFEDITGSEIAKKSLPKLLYKLVEDHRKNTSK
jgi:transposase-like protein